jgi:hypothetical protein
VNVAEQRIIDSTLDNAACTPVRGHGTSFAAIRRTDLPHHLVDQAEVAVGVAGEVAVWVEAVACLVVSAAEGRRSSGC